MMVDKFMCLADQATHLRHHHLIIIHQHLPEITVVELIMNLVREIIPLLQAHQVIRHHKEIRHLLRQVILHQLQLLVVQDLLLQRLLPLVRRAVVVAVVQEVVAAVQVEFLVRVKLNNKNNV